MLVLVMLLVLLVVAMVAAFSVVHTPPFRYFRLSISNQLKDFMLRITDWLYKHPLIRDQLKPDSEAAAAGDAHDVVDDLVQFARNELERYAMTLLHPMLFGTLPEDMEADAALSQQLSDAQFVTLDDLNIPKKYHNDVTLAVAQGELHKINTYQTPEDKLKAVHQTFQFLSSALDITSRTTGDGAFGADDLLPVFIFVVLHANVPRMASNIAYCERFRHASELVSACVAVAVVVVVVVVVVACHSHTHTQYPPPFCFLSVGYSFTCLRSAVFFLQNLNGSAIAVSEDEFARCVQMLPSSGPFFVR